MTSDLLRAVERLRVGANEHEVDQDKCVVDTLGQQRPRKQTTRGAQALKKELQKKFLTPQTSFDEEWLNRIQQYVVRSRGVRNF